MKKIIISVWILLCTYIMIDMGYEYYRYYTIKHLTPLEIKLKIETPVAKINVEADNTVEWELIGQLVALVLLTYGGIVLINKKIK